MIMQYLERLISIALLIFTFLFFILSIYVSYKGISITKSLPGRRSQISGAKYQFLSVLSLSLFLFVSLITENGFSWDAVCGSMGLLIMLSALLAVNLVITSKTTDYLNKRGISLDTLKKIRQIGKTNNNSDSQDNADDIK